jgi:hypothetical protein
MKVETGVQLGLFDQVDRKVYKTLYYKDFDINQRINIKGNSLGFASNYIRQLRPGFDKVHVINRYHHPEALQYEKILWDIKHNPKSIKTLVWKEKRKGLLINPSQLPL